MFIYRIKNLQNNCVYIGQSVNPKHRFSEHKRLLKTNQHDNLYLQRAFNKYGKDCFKFEIVECLLIKDQSYLNKREEYWINKTPNLYNIHKTVEEIFYPRCNLYNGFKGRKHSKKTKEVISKAVKEWHRYNDNPNKGVSMSSEQKKKLSIKAKDRLKNPSDNPSYINKKYKFVNKEDNFLGTPYEFKQYLERKGLKPDRSSITKLIKGKIKHHKGYRID